jgi:beta-galactosidase
MVMKKSTYFLLTIFALAFFSVKAQTPSRQVVPFNGPWSFTIDSTGLGVQQNWQESGIPAKLAKTVIVPHTWNVDSLTQNYYGGAWYEKRFKAEENWRGKLATLKFGAINRDCKVWFNGKLVAERTGLGYTGFLVDLSENMQISSENRITVWVSNKMNENSIPYQNSFDWNNDGGIYRDVKLIVSGKPGIENIQVSTSFTKNNEVHYGKANVSVKLKSPGEITGSLSFDVTVTEENQPSEKTIFRQNVVPTAQNENYSFSMDLNGVNLWHFDHPNLYKLKISVKNNDIITDESSTTFGFRTISTEGKNFLLNGEKVRLVGLEWMAGCNAKTGAVETEGYIRKILTDMKELNCVITRFHWQQDEKVIDLCNRFGILVQEEIPLWGKGTDFSKSAVANLAQKHLEEMISRDYNAPCIFAWGVGNELASTTEPAYSTILAMKQFTEKLDPSRMVSYVSNMYGQNPATDATKNFALPMWNEYYGTWFGEDAKSAGKKLDELAKLYPGKPVLIAEWGLCEPKHKGGDVRRCKDMGEHYREYEKRGNVAGYIYFCYNDYRTAMGEHGKGRFRQRVHGVVDINLRRKPSFDSLQFINSPVRIVNADNRGKILIVKVAVKKSLPSYIIENYILAVEEDGRITEKVPIPMLIPGDEKVIAFKTKAKSGAILKVLRPGGYVALKKRLVN